MVQSAEAVTCKMAATISMRRLDEEIGPENWSPLIFYHDEIEFSVKKEYAEKARQIAEDSFREGPLAFGIDIMEGDAKIGKTWLDVH